MATKLTYALACQCGTCRMFCAECVNTFAIRNCGPYDCDKVTSTICLQPVIPQEVCIETACGIPRVLILKGFRFADDLYAEGVDPESGSVPQGQLAIDYAGAQMHTKFDGDWILFNSVDSPCMWKAQRSIVIYSNGSDSNLGLCGACINGNIPCNTEITLYLIARYQYNYDAIPPGLGWNFTYAVGYKAYSAIPILGDGSPGNDCPQSAGEYIIGGNLWLSTSLPISQDPAICAGEFPIDVLWRSVDGTPSVLVGGA